MEMYMNTKDLNFSMRAFAPMTLAGFEPDHGDVRLVRALIVVCAPTHPLSDAGGELRVRGHMIQQFDEEEYDEGYAGAWVDVCPAVDGRDHIHPWPPAFELVAAADRAAISLALASGNQR